MQNGAHEPYLLVTHGNEELRLHGRNPKSEVEDEAATWGSNWGDVLGQLRARVPLMGLSEWLSSGSGQSGDTQGLV